MFTDIKENENLIQIHDFLQARNLENELTSTSKAFLTFVPLCNVEKEIFGEIIGQYEDGLGIHFEYRLSPISVPHALFSLSAPYSRGLISPTEEFIQKILEGTGKPEVDPNQTILSWTQYTFPKGKETEVMKHTSTTIMYKGSPMVISQLNNHTPRASYV